MSYWKAGDRITANRFAKFLQAGQELVTFTSQDSFVVDVTFDVEFDSTPVMFADVTSGSGSTARWEARAINATSTGFQLFLYSNASGATATWTDVPVSWLAIAP